MLKLKSFKIFIDIFVIYLLYLYYIFFNFSHISWYEVVMILIYISHVANHFVRYLYILLMYTCIFNILPFFYCWDKRVHFQLFCMLALCFIYNCQECIHSMGCLLTFAILSFEISYCIIYVYLNVKYKNSDLKVKGSDLRKCNLHIFYLFELLVPCARISHQMQCHRDLSVLFFLLRNLYFKIFHLGV